MSTTFFCNLNIPILVGEDRYKYLPVVAVFRSLAHAQVDDWVMDPAGGPRSDRHLAAEGVVDLPPPPQTSAGEPPQPFDVADILQLDRAAAIIVATYLAALPRL